MLISQQVGTATEGWQSQPGYAEVSQSAPNASASWTEYTAFIDANGMLIGVERLPPQ